MRMGKKKDLGWRGETDIFLIFLDPTHRAAVAIVVVHDSFHSDTSTPEDWDNSTEDALNSVGESVEEYLIQPRQDSRAEGR